MSDSSGLKIWFLKNIFLNSILKMGSEMVILKILYYILHKQITVFGNTLFLDLFFLQVIFLSWLVCLVREQFGGPFLKLEYLG